MTNTRSSESLLAGDNLDGHLGVCVLEELLADAEGYSEETWMG